MNFFEHQDQARSRTGILVFLYLLAVLGLAGTAGAVMHFVQLGNHPPGAPLSEHHWNFVATAAIYPVVTITRRNDITAAPAEDDISPVASMNRIGVRTTADVVISLSMDACRTIPSSSKR